MTRLSEVRGEEKREKKKAPSRGWCGKERMEGEQRKEQRGGEGRIQREWNEVA